MMMSFSATDAAFEGFRVVRRAPLSLLFWILTYVVAGAAMFAVVGGSLARLMATSRALESSEPSLEEVMQVFQMFGAIFAFVMPIALLLGAVLAAAVSRSVLNPGDKAWGYVRLGMDELRVLATQVIIGLATFALMMVAYMVLGALGAAAYAMEQGWIWLIVVLGGLAAFGVVIWLSVRWSLATPIAVAEKRIAPFASFGLTKGRFWPLLGMAVLAFVLSLLVSLLFTIVTFPLEAMFGGLERLADYEGQDVLAMLTQAWPLILVWGLVNAISSALQLAVLYAPFTAAYVAIKGDTTA
jgi:hypothetical protein